MGQWKDREKWGGREHRGRPSTHQTPLCFFVETLTRTTFKFRNPYACRRGSAQSALSPSRVQVRTSLPRGLKGGGEKEGRWRRATGGGGGGHAGDGGCVADGFSIRSGVSGQVRVGGFETDSLPAV
jgi:hypothetical protein